MKKIVVATATMWLISGCASHMVEQNAKDTCAGQGKTAFIFNAKQEGIPLFIESASAQVLCVGPDDLTHLPASFGADAVSASTLNGAGIFAVSPGAVADKATVAAGDIVYEFAGKHIGNAMDLRTAINEVGRGEQVAIKLRRKGRELAVTAGF